jgi:hypothetical protein
MDVNKDEYDSNDNTANDSSKNMTATNSSHRWLHENATSTIRNHNNNAFDFYSPHRWLAEDSTAKNDCGLLQLTDDIYRRNVALTFCISLAMIFTCLDLMTICHIGINTSYDRCVCPHTKQYNIRGFILGTCRIGLVIFTATMAIWEENVKTLTIIGLWLTISQNCITETRGILL